MSSLSNRSLRYDEAICDFHWEQKTNQKKNRKRQAKHKKCLSEIVAAIQRRWFVLFTMLRGQQRQKCESERKEWQLKEQKHKKETKIQNKVVN